MATFERVPVVDVHTDNFKEIWPSLILAMSSSAFVALDTELSGLGQRKLLNAKSVEDRYKNISDTAKTRSILALGVSCFKLQDPPENPVRQSENSASQSEGRSVSQSEGRSVSQSEGRTVSQSEGRSVSQSKSSYLVQTFNITILCEEDYVVEPGSLRFLVQHGFDFNRQYDKGVSYYRGNDKGSDSSIQSIRHLFTELISMKLPIIVHNGLVDLVFLYQNLYCSLPASSASFLADLVDLFPSGIIDTKYVTDFEHLMQASYLEYVYRKCQRDNSQNHSGCDIIFPRYPASSTHVSFRECSIKPANDFSGIEDPRYLTCDTYTGHGWCTKGKFCPKSHDIDLIIDIDDFTKDRKSRKRKRRKQNQQVKCSVTSNGAVDVGPGGDMDSENVSGMTIDETSDATVSENGGKMDLDDKVTGTRTVENRDVESDSVGNMDTCDMCENCRKSESLLTSSGGHRAGYDAFMTGFIYAVYLTQVAKGERDRKIVEWKNKLYLSGKDYPLSVIKSNFVKQSKEHLEKIAGIRRRKDS